MSCQTHRQTLLDLARGTTAAADAAAAQAHAAECPACGPWLVEQQRLTVSLQALARATRVPAPAEMQRRLESAFDVYHAARRPAGSRWLQWAAAAAIIVCGVSLGVWRLRPAPSPEPAGGQAPPPAEQARGIGAPLVATAPRAVPPRESATASAANPSLPRPRRANRTSAADRPFVAIPSAAALPPLESAQIFRVDLPVRVLPAYGFDIAPEATGGHVTADVLVGQDGQPRAIRLVNSDQSAGSTR